MKKMLLIFLLTAFLINYSLSQKKNPTLEDMWITYTFMPKSIDEFRSMEDGLHYTIMENKNKVVKYSYKTGKQVEVLFDLTKISQPDEKPNSINSYEFNTDESKLLVTTDVEQIYRHSYKAEYWIWDIKTKKLSKLSQNGKQQLATLSPDGNKVAFARDNNLFITDLISGTEKQITDDGEWASIINGVPDWVYEEEFSFSQAFEWSPDGNFIAYMKFDERRVKEFNMTMYGSLYPEWYNYKYPKAGEDNSIVSLHVYNLKTEKTIEIECGKENDQYIPRIKWTPLSGVLSFIRMNRLQNHLELIFADVNTGNTSLILEEKNNTYIEITDNWEYDSKGKSFIWYSEKSGFNHIYKYDINGKLINQITKGDFDVTDYLGYDEKNEIIYFISAEVSPLERHLYSIKTDGNSKKQLSQNSGTNTVKFSKGHKYYINTFSSVSSPPIFTLHQSSGKQVRVLEDNKALVEKLKAYNLPEKEFFTFNINEDTELNGWLIKPTDFNPEKQYPVFMTVYGGPNSQDVKNNWAYTSHWYQIIAQKGYIVMCVDNRGTGARGTAFRQITYKQLGKYEAIDQTDAAKYIATKPWVDKTRIGIYGWSYGGYLSSLCLLTAADVFKMAIAVAPVTNWRYYDTIYTERYNGLPQDNPDGYDDNSPISHVKKLKGNLLLIHGTADDNVHYQNSIEMVSELVNANKQFDTFFYPNSNHGIYSGRNTRYHLFLQMTNYIEQKL